MFRQRIARMVAQPCVLLSLPGRLTMSPPPLPNFALAVTYPRMIVAHPSPLRAPQIAPALFILPVNLVTFSLAGLVVGLRQRLRLRRVDRPLHRALADPKLGAFHDGLGLQLVDIASTAFGN